ncbi:MAG: glycine cleavage system aminomethyltransferase GcvT [Planctomycetota bacterium]
MAELAKTPLHDWHAAHGGRMVDFAGWSMPVQYTSIVEEHIATRTAAGLFDISHMGRLLVGGDDAEGFLDGLFTRRVTDLSPSQIRYSLVCNESGGVLDDVLVYRMTTNDTRREPTGFGLVVNADNREKIVAHLKQHAEGKAVDLEDITHEWAMMALQGPRAIELLDPLVEHELTSLRYYNGVMTPFAEVGGCYVSRTGYTGEDGCEVICEAAAAPTIWETLHKAATDAGGMAVGLGARDTLRLEAGMPLYGHELSEEINPIQAGLAFAVNLKDRTFVGSEAMAAAGKNKTQAVRVGLQLDGKRVAREGSVVLQGGEQVGEVTSGTFSPTLQRPLAMAMLKPTAAAAGTHLAVDIRGQQHDAHVAPLPFYTRGQA